jgi:CRP-like cAMP-binding protein
VVFGWQAVDIPANFEEIVKSWLDKQLTNKQAAELCGFSVRSLYRLTEERRRTDEEIAIE